MSLTNKVVQFDADSDLVNAWVHGGVTDSITTDSGTVASPAKLIADNEAEIQAVINMTNAWANGPATGTGSTVTLGGAAIASPAKVISDQNAVINAGATSVLALSTAQAGIATTQAGIATTKASEAATAASTASTQATTATTQAGIATTKAGEAASSATAASASAVAASDSSMAAAASAAAASTATGVTIWVSGTTYAVGDCRYSTINFLTYRRITAGAGTTDPASDPTNWVALTAIVSWLRKSANYTCNSGEHIKCSTTGGAWSLTLPASPQDGDQIEVQDVDGTFDVNPVALLPNGKTAMGCSPLSLNVRYFHSCFVYDATLGDWRI